MITAATARISSVSIWFSIFSFKAFWLGCYSILGEFPDIPILSLEGFCQGLWDCLWSVEISTGSSLTPSEHENHSFPEFLLQNPLKTANLYKGKLLSINGQFLAT